ncbi:MAG TPA: hypothetical protein VKG24_25330 [Pseudolabrys sp.]|nr:hypothetical protein [Pseudolabrys sp.]
MALSFHVNSVTMKTQALGGVFSQRPQPLDLFELPQDRFLCIGGTTMQPRKRDPFTVPKSGR